MKCLIILVVACVGCASAGHLNYGHPSASTVSTGQSSQYRSEDNHGNFQFGYEEAHSTGSTSRREEQVNGVRRGSYTLSDIDGRQRTVEYVADASGFHATIHSNEPGVEPKDPANVIINKDQSQQHAVAALPAPPAPLALAAPAHYQPLAAAHFGPAQGAVASYGGHYAPRLAAGPLPAQVYGHGRAGFETPLESATPRSFSYNFGTSHASSPVASGFASYAPQAAAPAFQHSIKY